MISVIVMSLLSSKPLRLTRIEMNDFLSLSIFENGRQSARTINVPYSIQLYMTYHTLSISAGDFHPHSLSLMTPFHPPLSSIFGRS